MIKFDWSKIFQYNSELCACRFFGKVEVFWCQLSGSWHRPSEWVFEYHHAACDCHMLEVAWFGFTILGHFCGGKFKYE